MKKSKITSRLASVAPHLVALLVVIAFGILGTRYLGVSHAASYNHNPISIADYCTLEGTSTVLYGWAHDPDAPAGANPYTNISVSGATVSVASSISGYRDAAINTYLGGNDPGAPTSSIYGWKLVLTGRYKGTSNIVSGTAVNYGTGGNTAMQVNTTHSINGQVYFNSNSSIPDACLTSQPVASTPAPTSTPTPAPTPVTTIVPAKKVAPKSGSNASTPSASAVTPAASTPSDAVVTFGTTTASFVVPNDGATSIYIRYGTDSTNLDLSSDAQTVSGDNTTFTVSNLHTKSTYYYQLARVVGTATVNSTTASSTTKGYAIQLLFTDASGKPVKNIEAAVANGKKQTSGSDGKVTFYDLSDGAYSAVFSYNSQDYSQDFSTSSAPTETGTAGIILTKIINVSNLTSQPTAPANNPLDKSSSVGIIIGSSIFLLLLGFGIFWWLRRRRRSSDSAPVYPVPSHSPTQTSAQTYANSVQITQTSQQSQPLQVPAPSKQQQSPQAPTTSKTPVPTQQPEHMGESLRDMVLRSMAEEAVNHPGDRPKPPIVPGQR